MGEAQSLTLGEPSTPSFSSYTTFSYFTSFDSLHPALTSFVFSLSSFIRRKKFGGFPLFSPQPLHHHNFLMTPPLSALAILDLGNPIVNFQISWSNFWQKSRWYWDHRWQESDEKSHTMHLKCNNFFQIVILGPGPPPSPCTDKIHKVHFDCQSLHSGLNHLEKRCPVLPKGSVWHSKRNLSSDLSICPRCQIFGGKIGHHLMFGICPTPPLDSLSTNRFFHLATTTWYWKPCWWRLFILVYTTLATYKCVCISENSQEKQDQKGKH